MPDEAHQHKCPTCGSRVTRPAPVLVDLNDNTAVSGRRRIKLTPREAEMLHVLMENYPARVSPAKLFAKVYGVADDAPDPRIIYVLMNQMRNKLVPLGIGVTVRASCGGRYDSGGYKVYRLPPTGPLRVVAA